MAAAPLAAALAGIRVLDLSRLLPGPYLTMVLADLGADVVKIEDPRVGDYLRAFPPAKAGMAGRFLAVNRGKRSLALDLKAPGGRAAFLRMVERADVVVESFRPGVMDKLGVGWSVLSAKNPRLVLCSISGYGQTGPYVERAGHDLNYISLAGVTAMGGGERGGAPTMPGVQIADLAGGALWSATGILAALVGRERTGAGAHLDISMTEGALALLAAEYGNLDCGARPTRGAETLNGGMACYQLYRTADDRWLSVGALEPKFWLAFSTAIGRKPNLAELAASGAEQQRIRGEIQAVLATKPLAEWLTIFAAHDCCCEPVLEMDELAAHPLHRDREVFFTIDGGAAGPIGQMRTPLGAPARPTLPPRLGEHGRAVLADYGFTADEIEAALEA
jgi:crotonobetainyl-CoA:carnitine CoA-transferase CaiB-like acyl-CoA transferase